ncbi:MAG: aspartate kinase [Erysipelotrichaceae bacterium]
MIKIAKFGGSSLADANQYRKVKEIIKSDEARRFIVVSAAGKRNKEDHKITDLLFLCNAHIRYGVPCDSILDILEERLLEISNDLHLKCDLHDEIKEFRNHITKLSLDELVSRGEYFSAKLLADYLGYSFVDAKDVIYFRYDGSFDEEKSQAALSKILETNTHIVVPGFYGSLPDGKIKTMARGGSDITGSYMASMLDADVYENWTDVEGILMADPRIVHKPRRIEKLTYTELRELSYMGANVLHEDAIAPIKDKNIPINIKNTNNPDNPGTIIVESVNDQDSQDGVVTGIAGRKDFCVVSIYKNHMSTEIGIIAKALRIFEKYRVSIEHIPSGIDSFSIVVDRNEVKDAIYDIVSEIKEVCVPDHIKVIEDIALIATVGRNMSNRPGISGKLFATLGDHGINIRMIAQGSDEINIIVGVENKDFARTVKTIYENFIADDNIELVNA